MAGFVRRESRAGGRIDDVRDDDKRAGRFFFVFARFIFFARAFAFERARTSRFVLDFALRHLLVRSRVVRERFLDRRFLAHRLDHGGQELSRHVPDALHVVHQAAPIRRAGAPRGEAVEAAVRAESRAVSARRLSVRPEPPRGHAPDVRDDDVRRAVREQDALAPPRDVRVVAEVHARNLTLQRLALGPVLVAERRHEVRAGGRRGDGQAAVGVRQKRREQSPADAVAGVREDHRLGAVADTSPGSGVGGGERARGGGVWGEALAAGHERGREAREARTSADERGGARGAAKHRGKGHGAVRCGSGSSEGTTRTFCRGAY